MKNIKKIDYVPNIDCSCVQVSWKCFGTGIDVMGIIGILLLLGGIVQIGAGTYFMIVLPIFDSASNIWTGVITCIVGIVYMYYGFTSQTERKHYSNLSLALLALITNVANLVIIVVGERGIFLSEEDKLQIDRTSKNNLYNIAIWGTTSTSCTIILILFMVAQFIFCGYIQPGSSNKLQGRKKERFFPPSRIINSKVQNDWNHGMRNGPARGSFGGGNINTNFVPIEFQSGIEKEVSIDGMTFETKLEFNKTQPSPQILKSNEILKFETFKCSKKPEKFPFNTFDNPSFVKGTTDPDTSLNTETITINRTTISSNNVSNNKTDPKSQVIISRTKKRRPSTIKRPTIPPPSPPKPKK